MLSENMKIILGDIGYACAVLMDLSKAFDTINHERLIAKLHTYGFSKEALTLLLAIYLIGGSMLKQMILLGPGLHSSIREKF